MESLTLQMEQAEQTGAKPPKLLAKPPKRKRGQWEMDKIVDEWRSSTKASKMYLHALHHVQGRPGGAHCMYRVPWVRASTHHLATARGGRDRGI